MRIRLSKRLHPRKLSTRFGKLDLAVEYGVSPITRSLYLRGTLDGSKLIGFIYRGLKRGTLGGYVLHSEALRKREVAALASLIAYKCRFNGVAKCSA